MESKVTIKNILAYITGNVRSWFWETKLSFLIPTHIREQIHMRFFSMNKECYLKGSCVKCGCMVPELQLANKACEGDCYPNLVNKSRWKAFKESRYAKIGPHTWRYLGKKFIRMKHGR